jgi:hypothetical protein
VETALMSAICADLLNKWRSRIELRPYFPQPMTTFRRRAGISNIQNTFDKPCNDTTASDSCRYHTDNSYIKYNNNNINSLQIYDTTQNYGILHEVVQRFSQHNFKISNHRHSQKLHKKKIEIKLVCL